MDTETETQTRQHRAAGTLRNTINTINMNELNNLSAQTGGGTKATENRRNNCMENKVRNVWIRNFVPVHSVSDHLIIVCIQMYTHFLNHRCSLHWILAKKVHKEQGALDLTFPVA